MNSSSALKPAVRLVLVAVSLCLPTLALAAQDPCAAGMGNAKCTHAINDLHKRTTEHGAGAAHARAAVNATHPLAGAEQPQMAAETPATSMAPQEVDHIHSAEAHPMAARHERQQH